MPGSRVTLDVPDDGIFHFTTIAISGTLTFRRNPAFNPPVILLSTGDITINTGGRIRVNGSNGTSVTGGLGGPGGFDGGEAGVGGGNPGAGHGPGAGGPGTGTAVAGNAAYGGDPPFSNNATDGVVYGSPLLVPLAGGSGGGGDENLGGGGGGGALLVCSPTRIIVNGTSKPQGRRPVVRRVAEVEVPSASYRPSLVEMGPSMWRAPRDGEVTDGFASI